MAHHRDSPDAMIQLADSAVQTPPRFDWREALQWETILKIAIVVVIALVAYRIITILIRRLLRREIEEEDPLVRRLREQRAQTLASLLDNVALVAIFIVVTLTILDILLDNIAPILASFGILGLAISFGAQSLVKDIISGTFMLMEGQFGIGDVVRVSDVSGAVEKITLRTTVLRDVEGVVHIIPNGEITRVSNLTKSWSRAVLNIGVAYREDVDRVMDVLRDLVREFHADPEWGALLLEEPLVPGVESLGDSAVVIRVSAKTLPLKQWDVARELRRRIKKRFDHEGIEIPFPHTTMYWGDGQMPALPAAVDSDLT
ncbi:MAG TPA: mechanosensitive ion channel family protein [Longimicrobiales bacterium]|nr:mechanosensitive ion channel family protein [Longimicrobiales bacterium]